MISSLVSQILNIKEKPIYSLFPMNHERLNHRTALDKKINNYYIHCHREIKKNAQKQK